MARLATFPEENPNLVIEMDRAGRVTYVNPEARTRFPDLSERHAEHPLLAPVRHLLNSVGPEDSVTLSHEVRVGEAVFEQKVCHTPLPAGTFIRIYAHDITALRQAEAALHDLANRVVSAQEDERRRVSRELHDEAGQALTALKISLELIRGDMELDPNSTDAALGDAIALVDETREQVRRLAHGLRPPALDVGGIAVALDQLARDFSSRTRIEVDRTDIALVEVSEPIAICLYRVMQEALTNAAAHASAHRVTVRLFETVDETVRLEIADDGPGMRDPVTPGIGLIGMRERVELLGGRLEIDGRVGTHVVAELPRGFAR